MPHGTTDGYYEEAREGQIIPEGSRAQPGTLRRRSHPKPTKVTRGGNPWVPLGDATGAMRRGRRGSRLPGP